MLVVARSRDSGWRDGFFDTCEFSCRQFHVQCRQRFRKLLPRPRADHRNYTLPFGEDPGDCQLRRLDALFCGEFTQRFDDLGVLANSRALT